MPYACAWICPPYALSLPIPADPCCQETVALSSTHCVLTCSLGYSLPLHFLPPGRPLPSTNEKRKSGRLRNRRRPSCEDSTSTVPDSLPHASLPHWPSLIGLDPYACRHDCMWFNRNKPWLGTSSVARGDMAVEVKASPTIPANAGPRFQDLIRRKN